MRRAAEIFALDVRASPSPWIAETWRTRSAPVDTFISVAAAHWELVVTRGQGAVALTVRGPETRATTMPVPADAEFFGIQLSAGTYMPGLPPERLVDTSVDLPVSGGCFRLAGAEWPVPGDRARADELVDHLAHAGLLVHDPLVAGAVRGTVVDGRSTRSLERRVRRATGLSRGMWQRIGRAERAVELLSRGMPASEVAVRAGYADQPHLTRSVRHLMGQTPAQIRRSAAGA